MPLLFTVENILGKAEFNRLQDFSLYLYPYGYGYGFNEFQACDFKGSRGQ